MKALILAAGYATRLYPLTKDRPKALLPLGKRTMLGILMDSLVTLPELSEIHLVTNRRFADQFTAWAGEARARYGALTPTVWDDGTDSNENRLGAIGDMRFVLDRVGYGDDWLVTVSDDLFTFDLRDMAAAFAATGQDTLCAREIDSIETLRGFAVALTDEKGTVTHLEEKPREPKSRLGVYGLYLYRADTLPLIAQYLEEGNTPDSPGHFPAWLYTRKPVHVFTFQGECVDIGTPEVYEAMRRRYAEKD